MHDAVVIGGGPGGSTAAHLLAAAGRDVLLLERERFPRFHIGESLLPWNTRIFERLGVLEAMKARYIPKYGVEFLSSDDTINRLFHFDEALDPRYPMAFEVLRSDLDQLLLDRAREAGARVEVGSEAVGVRRDNGTWTVTVLREGGDRTDVKARFLLDASGRDGFLARTFSLRDMDPSLRKASVFAHYRGVWRRDGIDAGNIVIVLLRDGWFWFIPFLNGTTSVGLVADGARLREQKLSPETLLEKAIETCPAAGRVMKDAERISPVYATSDWTYTCRSIAGDGYLLIGDASAFLDPVFSSGVMLSMSSGEHAADLLTAALGRGDLSRRAFAAYEPKVLEHVARFRRIVKAFYTPAFPDLIFFPSKKMQLPRAVISLLAGNVDYSFAVRWRLAVFFGIAWLKNRFTFGDVVALHRAFDPTATVLPRESRV